MASGLSSRPDRSWRKRDNVERIEIDRLDLAFFVLPRAAAIFMFVIGGNAPKAEFTDKAMKELEELGVWPRK